MAKTSTDRNFHDAVYDAEIIAVQAAGIQDDGYRWPRDCDRYVRHVMRTPWFVARWGERDIHVEVVDRKRTWGRADTANGVVYLARNGGRRFWVMLHELAHMVTPDDGHGPEFARALLTLWEHAPYVGPDAAAKLAKAFDIWNVRVSA